MKQTPRFIVALGSIALADAGALTRIPIAILGKFVKGAQKFAITRQTLGDFIANFRKRGADLVIDYEHASDRPEVAQGQPIPAAGWLKALDDAPDGEGILWGAAEFTDQTREMIAAKQLRYLSPSYCDNFPDKSTGVDQGATLRAIAVTNRPFLDQMPAISLSEGWQSQTEETPMSGKSTLKLTDAKDGMHVACSECGKESLADMPTDFSDHFTKKTAPVTEPVETTASDAIGLSDVVRTSEGRIDRSKFGKRPISIEVVQAMENETVALSEVETLVKAGKILPARRGHYQRIALNDLTSFREIAKDMAKAVDLSERGHGGGGAEDSTAVQLSDVDKQLGELTRAEMAANANLTYVQASKIVLVKNSALREKRERLMSA